MLVDYRMRSTLETRVVKFIIIIIVKKRGNNEIELLN